MKKGHLRRNLAIGSGGLIALIIIIAIAVSAARGTTKLGSSLSSEEINAIAQPATVMVVSTFSASVTVPDHNVNNATLGRDLQAQIAAGTIDPYNTDQQNAFIMQDLTNNIYTIMTPDPNPADDRTERLSYSAQGSGFIVSPDGYVVTNAHVAAPDAGTQKALYATYTANDLANADITRFEKSLSWTFPADVAKSFYTADTAWINRYMTVSPVTTSYATYTGVNLAGVGTANKGITASLIAAGDPIGVASEKDVAILKLEGQHDMPTLPLGDESSLQTGDALYIEGYPAVATFNPVVKADQTFAASFTHGQLSGRKVMTGGWSVLQTDAPSTHGNSGGPVLNQSGEVVGILTFGSVDPATGQEIQGFNFVVPASIVKEILVKAGASNSTSQTTRLFEAGLSEYNQKHYKIAEQYFTEADSLYPGAETISSYKQKAVEAVAQGQDATPFYYCWFNNCPGS